MSDLNRDSPSRVAMRLYTVCDILDGVRAGRIMPPLTEEEVRTLYRCEGDLWAIAKRLELERRA